MAASAVPSSASAHEGAALAPHDLWTAWTFEPWVVVLLVASMAAFVIGAARLRIRARRWPAGFLSSAVLFALGWLVLAASLVSPIHALGSALFSAHMAQHELLMVLAAPLLVAARPIIPAIWVLPASARLRIPTLVRRLGIASIWRIISMPLVAWLLHGAAIWVWHIPSLYGATIRSEMFHTAQHASFLLTALLFWWTILPASSASRNGPAVLSLFATALHTSVLGALLTFSDSSWYPAYQATTGPWGMSPVEDQQLGGLIMWIPGGVTYLVVALLAVARLLRDDGDARAAPHHGPVLHRAGAPTAAVIAMLLVMAACRQGTRKNTELIVGSDHERGQQIMGIYGCPSCHVIPGVRGANGKVGPPLEGIADRVYIAGRLANEPQNMIDWIRAPQSIDPQTAMPNTGVSERDARDIAAYLYTLK